MIFVINENLNFKFFFDLLFVALMDCCYHHEILRGASLVISSSTLALENVPDYPHLDSRFQD